MKHKTIATALAAALIVGSYSPAAARPPIFDGAQVGVSTETCLEAKVGVSSPTFPLNFCCMGIGTADVFGYGTINLDTAAVGAEFRAMGHNSPLTLSLGLEHQFQLCDLDIQQNQLTLGVQYSELYFKSISQMGDVHLCEGGCGINPSELQFGWLHGNKWGYYMAEVDLNLNLEPKSATELRLEHGTSQCGYAIEIPLCNQGHFAAEAWLNF